jgi:serine/threonine protein kinase
MVSHEPKYEHISEKMKDLIRLLLTPNPDKRPTLWELEVMIDSFKVIPEISLSDDALEIKKRQEE